MPETGALIGTPASISDIDEPQTDPIDGLHVGRYVQDFEGALRERPMADVASLRAAHEARLPDRERREVVVVHVAALRLGREVVDPLLLLGGAERAEREDLRLPARKERRAVRPR